MTSEDWKTVLLAFIGVLGSIVTVGGSIFGTYLMIRLKSMKQLINGRMDELLDAKDKEREVAVAKAFTEGHAAGVAKMQKGVAQSPNISIDAQEMAKIAADSSLHLKKDVK